MGNFGAASGGLVQGERFLGLTGPMGRRVLKFDGAFGPKGCGGGFAAGCVEGLHRFAQGATAASPLRVTGIDFLCHTA